jgi:hypothetical protein
MPLLPTDNSRPDLPYVPAQSLPNNARFNILTTTKRPPTAEMLDAEFNALTDDVNMLAKGINDVQVGSIPGSDVELNANKLLKTDGEGNLSWTLITNTELEPGAVKERGLAERSVTEKKIDDGAVTNAKLSTGAVETLQIADGAVKTLKIEDKAVKTEKIEDKAVTNAKLSNGAVKTLQIADGAVKTEKIEDKAVTTEKIEDKAVTTQKLSSSGGLPGSVLTAGSGSSVNWSAIPTTGKILQIASYVTSNKTFSSGEEKKCVFNPHFALTLTPKSKTSFIGLFITMQASPLTVPGWVSARLYRNNTIYIPLDFNSRGAMFSKYITATDTSRIGLTCFSGFFQDTIDRQNLDSINYEIVTLENVILNGDQNATGSLSYTTISSIYGIEVQI